MALVQIGDSRAFQLSSGTRSDLRLVNFLLIRIAGMNSTDRVSRIGWVLYDDGRGFGRSWFPFWAQALRRRGYDIAPLRSRWVQKHFELPPELTLYDLRLLLLDGTDLQGPEVYRHLIKQIWWAYPLYLLASAPMLRQVFDVACRHAE